MGETVGDRISYRAEFDEAAYWERCSRNQAWLGDTEEEARANQLKLRDATIGIAGVGGIGGAVAMRLTRMGAGRFKLADPEDFDMSNIQRQSGARLDTIGRNKAEVVAEQTYELTRDVDIEVFSDGITAENAEEFVEGCDVIADQIEFFELDARYALQRAARASERCGQIITVATVGHGALVVKYEAGSISSEEAWGLQDGASREEMAQSFVANLLPEELIPSYPSREALREFLMTKQIAPIWGATPALCEGVLVDQICAHVIGFPGMRELPVQPGYAWMDMFSWRAGVKEA